MEATQQAPAQVAIRRTYRATAEKVWRAWTETQALSLWFGAGKPPSVTDVEMDVRVGGHYRIAFVGRNGTDINEVSGMYQEVVPHRRLVFTFAWKGSPERVSRVSIELKPVDGGTELFFVHDRFFDEEARANHQRGWEPAFENLGNFLQRP